MNGQQPNIAVIGAGSWGTALAALLARNGVATTLWGRDAEKMAHIRDTRCNERYLPDVQLPDALDITSSLDDAVNDATDLLLVIPSQGFRQTLKTIRPMLKHPVGIAWASKGMEPESCKLLHELVSEEMGKQQHMAVLSGPTFAKEVVRGLPTAITAASFDHDYAQTWAELLSSDNFRAYTSSDVIGVEVGGAVKNVLAIAAGIADGLGLGANTRAALITRGLVEVQRLGVALGAHAETLMGLAGLGDLVLTCTDDQSRNRRVGLALATGRSLDEILVDLGQVAEGVYAAKEVHELAQRTGVEMPIVEQVYSVIYHHKDPHVAVHELLARSIKSETI